MDVWLERSETVEYTGVEWGRGLHRATCVCTRIKGTLLLVGGRRSDRRSRTTSRSGRLPGKGNSNSHGARPVHLIFTMIKWIRTSRLSIKKSLSSADVPTDDPAPRLEAGCGKTLRPAHQSRFSLPTLIDLQLLVCPTRPL